MSNICGEKFKQLNPLKIKVGHFLRRLDGKDGK